MSSYQSFSVRVPGKGKNEHTCQDASLSKDYKDASVSIAIVADGHGDSNCFRSDKGAKFAVERTKLGIYRFVQEHEKLFKQSLLNKPNPPSHSEFEKCLREKLIKQIIAAWNKEVMDDYEKNPFKPEELEKASEKYRERYNKDNPQKYQNGKYISKAYGATLIAAAITPYYWFGFHIGDGRFSVLYSDGNGDQPVPWDERCYLNVTTSICDDDILEHEQGVRSTFSFNSEKEPPIAVFLCTDGIDDNYPVKDNEIHLYRLYRTIAVTFAEDGYNSTCTQLKELAEGFVTKGKGDDTSIAGFINMEEMKKVALEWQKKINEAEAKRAEEKVAEEEADKKAETGNPPTEEATSEVESIEKIDTEEKTTKEEMVVPATTDEAVQNEPEVVTETGKTTEKLEAANIQNEQVIKAYEKNKSPVKSDLPGYGNFSNDKSSDSKIDYNG